MKKLLFILVLLAMIGGAAQAQGLVYISLDASVHGTTHELDAAGTRIYDDGGVDGNYSKDREYFMTMQGTCDTPYAFRMFADFLDIAEGDTLFVHNGPDTNSPVIWYATGNITVPQSSRIWCPKANTDKYLTIHFKTSGPNPAKGGFSLTAGCEFPCEIITPYIDSIFYKTHNGEIYEFGRIKTLYDTNTVMVWDDELNDSVPVIDSTAFLGVNLCRGDGVIFTGHCNYTYVTGWYTPHDSSTYFLWDLGMGDTIEGNGVTSVYYDQYYNLACYEVFLQVTDVNGCEASTRPNVRVRLAQNPLKTLFTLQDICNRDSLLVNMGYDGDNATLTLKKIDFVDMRSRTNAIRQFIPDGPRCDGPNCYVAPVVFDDFPAGALISDAKDVCSVCVNYEHTYMGDYDLSITCPTYGTMPNDGGKSVLKFYSSPSYPTPAGTSGGGGRYTGLPFGFGPGGNYDAIGGDNCDSLQNPYGEGWNYCFSRNGDYTLVSGQACDDPDPTNAGMSNGPQVEATTTFVTPPGFSGAGTTYGPMSHNTLDSSDHINKLNYYIPGDDFSQLVGCPMNGTWNIEVCDHLGRDNGWVFSWSLDICGSTAGGCKYQVAIDSVVWAPDTSAQYHDYELGHYRGAEVHKHNDLEAYILTPDTAGKFRLNVTIYDEFGCVWDTNTFITSYWTPMPDLGPDTALCGVRQIQINASDRHDASQHYTYLWEPFGQDSAQIMSQAWPDGDITYVAQVTNKKRQTRCVTRDTMVVKLRRQPLPSFMPTPFTLEGCDPLTLTFDNQTKDGYIHHWDFGDGITSELESPTHTYSEGIYDLKYYATSIDGCIDSLIYERSIAVYTAPQAGFSWTPTYPSVTNPVINLQNLTSPHTDYTKYFWELQYTRDNPLSVETLTDINPTFDYSTYMSSVDEIAGNYAVRLIARTDNVAPSGNIVYCRDTAENTVLVVNDYLTFPNVVTPNGDGYNDIFVIGNLIEGMGYPNNTLDIFNKWGTCVYHKENISSYADFWDPSGVPAGTYFYRFTAHGYNGNMEHNGAIEVLK